MKKNIKVLLVDDHQVVRDGLQHMLAQEEDIEIVGQSNGGEEVLSQLEELSPDIVLMDIKMPGINGIDLTRQLTAKQPSCKIIMLTLYDEYLVEAMEAGAASYLLKDVKHSELTRAIRQVHSGQVVIGEGTTSKLRVEYEEVQLFIHLPFNYGQLLKFISQTEELLQSHVQQMVGSWKDGATITLRLRKPVIIENILKKLLQMSEVEATSEKPLVGERYPTPLRKATAMSRPRTRLSKFIFVILKSDAAFQS